MNSSDAAFASAYRALDKQEQDRWIASRSDGELLAFFNIPEARLFDKQEVPQGDWRYCLFRCGRGFGKSIAGSAWLARKIIDGARSVALYGATFSDVHKIMVPNMISWFPPGDAVFNAGTNTINFFNGPYAGAKCYCLTSEKENRGLNLEYLWVDEIVVHADGIPEKIRLHFDVLDMAVRVGKHPQTLITSTPRPFEWFTEFQKQIDVGNPRYIMRTGTMFDNPYLSDDTQKSQMEKYSNTRLGRQELFGDLLEALEGALWSKSMLDKTRVDKKDLPALLMKLIRIVVGVDPAVTDGTKSDLTGIVVVGMDGDGNCYVLADYSGQYSPDAWARKVSKAVQDWDADCIVAEKNQGGQLVEANIRTVDRTTRIKLVHAKQGKILRAEPVAARWEQLKASMVGTDMMPLETEMVTFDGTLKSKSPDRLDAMVYAVWELVLNKVYVVRNLESMPYQ